MKHITSISLLVFTTFTISISTMHLKYELPDHQTITKRLWDAGFSNFAKESEMGKRLAKQCLEPLSLWGAVSNIRTEYLNNYPRIIKTWNYGSGEPFPPTCPDTPELVRIILQDYPSAIKDLERNQYLKSSEKITEEYKLEWKK